ncbi:helix-turn-helix domain-containing protein [Stutzerimonas stutzeri]|uniref:helix-turn-helix domain-containing protein n=1 Tax=Stutzerimonas stutzeri TaxID=316 RepID=UPI0003982B51|nr:XRE family transcriptional regulator [Stutzerimonas stutzeri]EQM80917.1 hypothetical protein L686_08645 [Stutzerimonas stutzeri MF28]
MNQNLFERFTDDPVEYNMKHLKTQLFMALIKLIRENGWTQSQAAKELKVSAPRMSNLFKGYLEKFSIDTLMEMLVRIGYKLDADFNPQNTENPLVLNLKKAMV